jgi:hypothetical protein
MKTGLAIFAAAGLAILFADAPSQAGSAAMAESAGTAQAAEWSAVRKKRYVRVYRKPAYVYRKPAYVYRAPAYGRLGDPSLGPDGRPYPRPYDMGGCIFDEGYGRFSACPNR